MTDSLTVWYAESGKFGMTEVVARRLWWCAHYEKGVEADTPLLRNGSCVECFYTDKGCRWVFVGDWPDDRKEG